MKERNRYALAIDAAMTELEAGLDFLLRDTPEKRRQYARTSNRRPHRVSAPKPG